MGWLKDIGYEQHLMDGEDSEEGFARNARDPQVKMIEVKLSQGAKPGHGGVLPGRQGHARDRGRARRAGRHRLREPGAAQRLRFTRRPCCSSSSACASCRAASPPASSCASATPWEWFAIAKAMLETGLYPDFIVVDGGRGRHRRRAGGVHRPRGARRCRKACCSCTTHSSAWGLRRHVKLGCAGKVTSAFDIVRAMALGADWCNSARGFMFALGCIQAQTCHTGACPTGVTAQDPQRAKAPGRGRQDRTCVEVPRQHPARAEGTGAGRRPEPPG